MKARYPLVAAAALIALLVLPLSAFAQSYDQMNVGSVALGHGKWTVEVTAGPSGAPNGFTVWWMKKSNFDLAGQTWFSSGNSIQAQVYFDGVPTLNTWGGTLNSFLLAPGQIAKIELGDVFDETGVTGANALGLAELESGTEYVWCAWALGDGSVSASEYSSNVFGSTSTNGEDCQFTIGYWKNHPEAWPVAGLDLGSRFYDASELMSILNQPAGGNGLIILAHQLIAAKLNVAIGADPTPIAAEIAAADALIGALVVPPVGGDYLLPSLVSATSQVLDDFNNGIIATICGPTSTESSTWGRMKALYR